MLVVDICDDEQLWIDKAYEIVADFFKDKREVWINSYNNSEDLTNSLINKKELFRG